MGKKGPVVLDVKSAACESAPDDSALCQKVPKLKKPAADCEVWFSMVDAFVRFAANWHAVQQTYMLHRGGPACQKKNRNGDRFVTTGSTGCLDMPPRIPRAAS